MEAYKKFTSRFVTLPVNDIDTDQIMPARFLKVTDKLGLGDNVFFDWRYNEDGSPKPEFILNKPEAKGVKILVAGDNFGCGSSREHAPWGLTGFGFKAIISTGFADIFRNNSLKNGLLPVIVDAGTQQKLFDLFIKNPKAELTINLEAQTLTLPDGISVNFPVDPFSKTCLVEGLDQLGYLLKFDDKVVEFEKTHPARINSLG